MFTMKHIDSDKIASQTTTASQGVVAETVGEFEALIASTYPASKSDGAHNEQPSTSVESSSGSDVYGPIDLDKIKIPVHMIPAVLKAASGHRDENSIPLDTNLNDVFSTVDSLAEERINVSVKGILDDAQDLEIPRNRLIASAARAAVGVSREEKRAESAEMLGLPANSSQEVIWCEESIQKLLSENHITRETINYCAKKLVLNSDGEYDHGEIRIGQLKLSGYDQLQMLFERGAINPEFIKAIAWYSVPLVGWIDLAKGLWNRNGNESTRVFPPAWNPDTDVTKSPALQKIFDLAAKTGCNLKIDITDETERTWSKGPAYKVPGLEFYLTLPELPKK